MTAQIKMKYTNYRGETAIRTVLPNCIKFGATTYHPQEQWLMQAYCTDRHDLREFALADCDFTMQGTLSAAYNAVRQFHKTFGHPAPDVPQMQPDEWVTRRAAWIMSEVDELVEAPTIIQQADAYLDVIYFALGGLVELGVEPSAIFDLVQAANMAKIWPDGSVQKDATGKVIKPVGWVAPDAEIADQIAQQIVNVVNSK